MEVLIAFENLEHLNSRRVVYLESLASTIRKAYVHNQGRKIKQLVFRLTPILEIYFSIEFEDGKNPWGVGRTLEEFNNEFPEYKSDRMF